MPLASIEKRREYNRFYFRNWYAKNGRKRKPGYDRVILKWERKNPEKVKARNIITTAVFRNRIKKPNQCIHCCRKTRLIGHHPDYSKPLEVFWICASCHKLVHGGSITLDNKKLSCYCHLRKKSCNFSAR